MFWWVGQGWVRPAPMSTTPIATQKCSIAMANAALDMLGAIWGILCSVCALFVLHVQHLDTAIYRAHIQEDSA